MKEKTPTMRNKLLSAYGLKVNPFSPDVPVEALFVTDAVDAFCWRVEQQLFDGGFAAVNGEPGSGKSVVLRILSYRLGKLRDVVVGVITRPQGSIADFYRELGHLFGVKLSPHNRYAGAKVLRETWLDHIESSTYRPVLLVDEAQEMRPSVMSELRLLSSMHLDSRALLTVVLAGDQRLIEPGVQALIVRCGCWRARAFALPSSCLSPAASARVCKWDMSPSKRFVSRSIACSNKPAIHR
jgi:general secretion pathway protein A